MRETVNAAARRLPTAFVYLGGCVPLLLLTLAAVQDRLGADPVAALQDGLGLWALRLLLASLSLTPLMWAGLRLIRFRRALGLLAFLYAALHFMCWVMLDMGMRWAQITQDLLKRPHILIGFLAFAALVPLAATSWNGAIRRMGANAWRRLHRLSYVAVGAAALHFVMTEKHWTAESLLYFAFALGLLAGRALHRSTTAKHSA